MAIKEIIRITTDDLLGNNMMLLTYIESEPKGYGANDSGERTVVVRGSNKVEAVERFKEAYDEFVNGDLHLGMAR